MAEIPTEEPTRYFGVFDDDGNPRAFYVTGDWALEDIPKAAVEISHDEWMALLQTDSGARYVDGKVTMP